MGGFALGKVKEVRTKVMPHGVDSFSGALIVTVLRLLQRLRAAHLPIGLASIIYGRQGRYRKRKDSVRAEEATRLRQSLGEVYH